MGKEFSVRNGEQEISSLCTRTRKYTSNLWVSWPLSFHGITVRLSFYDKFHGAHRSVALHNAWSPILAAIFAGNGIVLKCSENVIWSTTWFVGVITTCLNACGHDSDLVQIVCCWPEQAEALTRSPLIKHITFIGSEEVGRKVRAIFQIERRHSTMLLAGRESCY